jgi:hypothetical protein
MVQEKRPRTYAAEIVQSMHGNLRELEASLRKNPGDVLDSVPGHLRDMVKDHLMHAIACQRKRPTP